MEFPNATPQEKFMMMLLERIDALTDEVSHLRDYTIPKTEYRLTCQDIGCMASAAFIRARITNEHVADKLSQIIQNTKYIDKFVYDNILTKHFSIDRNEEIDVDDSDTEEKLNGEYTFQALVCFKHSVISSRIGVELCNKVPRDHMCSIELQPIYDYRQGFNHDNGLFTFYYYHIVAAKYRTHPEIVGEREMTWIKSDGTTFTHNFMGNTVNDNDFDDLIQAIDDHNITFHVYPWYYKQAY